MANRPNRVPSGRNSDGTGDTTLVDLSEENEDDEDGEPTETIRLNRIYYNM